MTVRYASLIAAWVAALAATPALAATTVYASQPAFQAALDGSYTLWNLDSPTFTAFGSGYRLDDAGPAAALAALGLDSIGANARVVSGQQGQNPTSPRDWLILNGQFFNGAAVPAIAFNFTTPVNGVGVISNFGDGGQIQLYSGANLTGTLLGQVQYGPGAFAGLTSTLSAGSVRFTCDFNADLACGAYDVQFGTFAQAPGGAVPEPLTWTMMILGFAATGSALRRRRPAIAA